MFFIQLAAWVMPFLPEKMAADGFRDLVLQHWPEQVTGNGPGLSLDSDLGKAGATFDVDYMDHYKEGKFESNPLFPLPLDGKLRLKTVLSRHSM